MGEAVATIVRPASGRTKRDLVKRANAAQRAWAMAHAGQVWRDFRAVSDIVSAHMPDVMPKKLKRLFRSPFDLKESLIIYGLTVVLEWNRDRIGPYIGRSRNHQKFCCEKIEEAREICRFVETICEKVKERGRGLC